MANAGQPVVSTPKKGQLIDNRYHRDEVLTFDTQDFGDTTNDATPWFNVAGAEFIAIDSYDTAGRFRGTLSLQFAVSDDDNPPEGQLGAANVEADQVANFTANNQRRNKVRVPANDDNWGNWARVVVTTSTTDPSGRLIVRVLIRRLESKRG